MVVTTLLDEFALVNTIRRVCPIYLLVNTYREQFNSTVRSARWACDDGTAGPTMKQRKSADRVPVSMTRLASHVSLAAGKSSIYEPLLWLYSILDHSADQFLNKNCWSRDSVVTCRRSRASVTRFSTLGLSYGDVPPGERVDQMSEDH